MTETAAVITRSLEVERTIIGALLAEGEGIEAAITERLTPDMFWSVGHGYIYQAICALDDRGEAYDATSVVHELKRLDQMEHIGSDAEGWTAQGGGYVHLLAMRAPLPMQRNVKTWSSDIRREGEQRGMLAALQQAAAQVISGKKLPATLWAQIQQSWDAARPYEPNANFMMGAQSFQAHDDMLKDEADNAVWFSVPWLALEDHVSVLRPGMLVGVIGTSGSGKSSMLYNWAEHYAKVQRLRTCYIFTEMRTKDVLDRRTVKHTTLDIRRLMKPDLLTSGEMDTKHLADGKMYDWIHKLDYWHAEDIAESTLFSHMLRMVQELGTKVFVIDYINDITVEARKGQGETQAMRDFLKRLEAFSNRHGVLLIIAAQKNTVNDWAYQIGQAFDQKCALVLEIQPEVLEHAFTFEYGGQAITYKAGKYKPVMTIKGRKWRYGGPFAFDLLNIGPRFLWVDVPSDFDDGSDDPGAFMMGRDND